jgi:sulfate/thiosulfate-binding protein
MSLNLRSRHLGSLFVAVLTLLAPTVCRSSQTILNVSYDPTRELYVTFNRAFEAEWLKTGHPAVNINQSNGASGKQAQAVVDGNGADVVTLALAYDIDHIAQAGLIKPGWQSQFKFNSTPYTSTIVFLVRKGNPKHIKDWSDLIRPGVQVITPNPKSSGGARWSFLAAYGYALRANHGDESKAQAFVKALYKNVPILTTGARGATEAFVRQQQGDVLLNWENDALLTVHKLAVGQYEIIRPSISILTEPPVAIVDANVDAHHTRAVATAYLNWLYSPAGQEIAADNYYRPRIASIAKAHAADFQPIKLFGIASFGGWEKAQAKFFSNGGVFDHIYSR